MAHNCSHRCQIGRSIEVIENEACTLKQRTDLPEGRAATRGGGVGQRALNLQKVDVGSARRRRV